ncbi:hypothetical protein [Microbacterium excoecariae]|uniref:hypothetical protein n=1 Tax=Microbacterium excoecariae TaxID=2715210 RepID=UPI00140829FF|nr:hypothetical protein [Microbacterium excoecariae]NHI16301.1 hypothetical protein [Microbacterium excoecariae]
MRTTPGTRHDPIAPGARLVHIGMPKTGTTALQTTAARRRAALRAEGVLYPGDDINHRAGLLAKLGVVWGWGEGSAVPDRRHWDALAREIRGASGDRVWLDHEFCATANASRISELVEDLGGPVHVVVTLRGTASLLASSWQQYLKSGLAMPFDAWLRAVLDGPTGVEGVTPSFRRRTNVAGVIDRWAAVVGADRVTAIVLDGDDRARVPETFEDMLGLSRGALDAEPDDFAQNRSFSWEEADLVLRVNAAIEAGGGLPWRDYARALRHGSVARLLHAHSPGPSETRILPPAWAVERSQQIAWDQAERIRAAGVRVVGDVDQLAAPVPSAELLRPESIPAAVAEAVAAGAVSSTAGRGWDFRAPEAGATGEGSVRAATAQIRTRELAEELARRIRVAVRARLRR